MARSVRVSGLSAGARIAAGNSRPILDGSGGLIENSNSRRITSHQRARPICAAFSDAGCSSAHCVQRDTLARSPRLEQPLSAPRAPRSPSRVWANAKRWRGLGPEHLAFCSAAAHRVNVHHPRQPPARRHVGNRSRGARRKTSQRASRIIVVHALVENIAPTPGVRAPARVRLDEGGSGPADRLREDPAAAGPVFARTYPTIFNLRQRRQFLGA